MISVAHTLEIPLEHLEDLVTWALGKCLPRNQTSVGSKVLNTLCHFWWPPLEYCIILVSGMTRNLKNEFLGLVIRV